MTAQSEGVVIVGAGGHGREAFDIAVESGLTVLGFVDDAGQPDGLTGHTGRPMLGPVEWLVHHPNKMILGIASPVIRSQLDFALTAAGCDPISVVHPSVGIGSGVSLGEGALVPQGCRISEGAVLGRHVHLGALSNIAHGSWLGDYVTATPGVLVGGDCTIETGVWLGAGCVVNQGITIGAGAVIGSGAVVVADVEPGVTMVGVPARPMRTSQPSTSQT